MGLLILALPVLEIWSLFFVGSRIGIVNTLFWLIASGVLGLGLIRAQGAFLMRNFQASLAKGQMPANQIFHSLVIFVAGALFMVPGFFSDLIALLLVLPGTRHVFVGLASKYMQKQLRKGNFRMATFGGAGGFAGFGGFGGAGGFGSGPMSSRDVTPRELSEKSSVRPPNGKASADIIDITPVKASDKRGDSQTDD